MSASKLFAGVALVLLLVPTSAFASPAPAAPATAFFPITVLVIDTQGLNIDGASVEIINMNTSAIVGQGLTVNGTFKSLPLGNNYTFNVIASTAAQTKQQYVQLTNGSHIVQFTLLRSLPLSQLSLSTVSFTHSPDWSTATGNFQVRNTGETNVTSSSIAFNASSPLIVLGSGSQFSLGAIVVGAGRNLTVNFAIQPLASQGVYSIPYVITFTDSYGRNFTSTGNFAFTLARLGVVGSSELVISSISYVLQQSPTGYTVSAQFLMTNTGEINVTSASLEFNASFPLSVLGSGSLFSVGAIGVNSTRSLTVNFAVQPLASPGVYSIPYVLRFTDLGGRNFTTTGSFGLNLNRVVGATQLVISSVSYNVQRSENAYTIAATMVIANSGGTNVTSASIAFNASSTLTIVGSGSLFSLGEIPVDSNVSLSITFVAQPKSGEGLFSVPYSLSYTSGTGFATEKGALSFLVNGTPDVEIASVDLSSTRLTPGANSILNVNVMNVGDQQALNVLVALGGMSPALSSNSSYIGILAAGANATTSFGLNLPTTLPVGPHSLSLIVSYQDSTGKVYTTTQPYHFNVFASGSPIVKVQNILTDPVVLTAGTNGLMTVYLVNVGNEQANNIVAKVSGAQDILATQDFTVGVINPNATVTTILGLNVDPSISTGSHLLQIDLTYTNPLGQSFNQSSFVEVTVYPLQTILTPLNEALLAGAVVAVIAVIIIARRMNIKI